MDNKNVEQKDWNNDDKKIWQLLEEIESPEPSEELRHKFYSMLETMKKEKKSPKSIWYQNIFTYLSANKFKMAYSLALLMVGSWTTYFIMDKKSITSDSQQNVYQLKAEVDELREMMMYTLLQNPMATERMKAVNYTKELQQPDDKILDALITTFKEDSNDNVRMVALNALVLRAEWPQVRKALIEALIVEKSPLIQAALADAMIKLHEKKSIDQMKKRLAQEELNAFVKQKFTKTIEKLSL